MRKSPPVKLSRAWVSPLLVCALGAATFLVVPPAEKALLTRPSCLAFVGLKQPERLFAPGSNAVRDLAIAQGAIDRPAAPYVLVTAVGGDADFTNVVLALKTSAGWRVQEASQPWDSDTQKLLPFKRLPVRMLSEASSKHLEALMAKDCLFREPALVPADPGVHFDLLSRGRTYDATFRTIEVNDGRRGHVVTQGHQAGISGAIGQVILAGSHGFIW